MTKKESIEKTTKPSTYDESLALIQKGNCFAIYLFVLRYNDILYWFQVYNIITQDFYLLQNYHHNKSS